MKTLQMMFMTDFGKSYTFNVANPKADLTLSEVKDAMQAIVDGRFLETTSGRAIALKGAKIVDRIETPLFKNE